MAVDEAQARIRRDLEDAVSRETADYLLDRPPGGWGDLATKGDLDRRFADLDTTFDAKLSALRSDLHGEISELRGDLHGEISELRGELGELRGEVRAGNAGLRGEVAAGMAELRGEMATGMADLRGAVADQFGQQLRWFTTAIVGAMTGLVVAVAGLLKL
jgi:hypothetical protein